MSRRDYGNGSIYFSDSRNRWVAQCKVGVGADGKIKRTTIYGKTKKEVKDKLERLKAEVLTGLYIEPSKATIVDLCKMIAKNKLNANVIKPTTYKRTLESIKLIEDSSLNLIPIQKVTELALTEFLNTLVNYSDSAIKKACTQLKLAYKQAIKMDIVTKNLMDYVLRPKSTIPMHKVMALTLTEQKALIEALNTDKKEPYRTMLLLSLFTGMRMGEVAALEYSPFIVKSRTITIKRTMTKDFNDKPVIGATTKTYAGQRTIKLNDDVVKLLDDYIALHYVPNSFGLMFVNKNKEPFSISSINSYYKRLMERYGIKAFNQCNQHQLRHTYATRCIEAGMPAKVLQKNLGHRKITTTLDTYTDVFDEMENKFKDMTVDYLKQNGIAI